MVKHLSEELAQTGERVKVQTRFGVVTGGKAENGAFAFLEIPYALPPRRFEDPEPLPEGHKYEEKEYVFESKYAAQPTNDGQAVGGSETDKLGLGQPTEDVLFLNIVIPPSFDPNNPAKNKFPVKVYIHGGFLQFGSPHGLSSQAQHAAAARGAVYVNIGYRLSVFGFLACDEPRVAGNFGFKDQWLALLWVKENISAFGGDPENVELTGLSAGAHSVHQILHHVSHLPEGEPAPFRVAVLQSNAIVFAPKTPTELRPQFAALCSALDIDTSNPAEALDKLKAVPWQAFTRIISAGGLGAYGIFRGCLDGSIDVETGALNGWIPATPEPMAWQRDRAGLGPALAARGVRAIVVGDVKDEWYLYALSDPISGPADVLPNLTKYYPESKAKALLGSYTPALTESSSQRESFERYGRILADAQVHLPVRMLARDLIAAGFPVLRYEILWTPEQGRADKEGLVTHATDRPLWCLRDLTPPQVPIATAWLDAIDAELAQLIKAGAPLRGAREALVLTEGQEVEWDVDGDERWDRLMGVEEVLRKA